MPRIYKLTGQVCPKCGGDKDARAKHCWSCREQPRKREGQRNVLPAIGYAYVMVGGKGRYEHRVVMERMIGRPLERHEHVHHKNGNKLDNRPENLELLAARDHHKEHMTSARAKEMSIKGHAARWGGSNSNI